MRKWMRDRLKRKKPEAGKTEASPAPLQPAYFDAGPGGSVPPEVNERDADLSSGHNDQAHDRQSPPEIVAEAASSAVSRPAREGAAAGGDPRRRRRRGRGGRGRGGSRPAVAGTTGAIPIDSTPGGEVTPAPQSAVQASAVTVPTPSKGSVILAIGLPGSGKSSWFKRHKITPLSSDMLRSLLFDDPAEQRFQDLIFSNLRSMLKARLIARRPLNYVDATNLTPHERQSWVKLGHDYGYEVQAVFFDVPLEVCLERNRRRERVVAEDVMRRMSAKLKAPTFEEGFSKITVVKVKQKE
jgi:predicted kinase